MGRPLPSSRSSSQPSTVEAQPPNSSVFNLNELFEENRRNEERINEVLGLVSSEIDRTKRAHQDIVQTAVSIGGGVAPETVREAGKQETGSSAITRAIKERPAQIITGLVGIILAICTIFGIQVTGAQVDALTQLFVAMLPLVVSLIGGTAIRAVNTRS